MSDIKFIGLDVHKTSVAVAVLDDNGKLVMRPVLLTQASAILAFIRGLRGTLRVTFEEGTHAAWLYDLLKPHVAEVLVCDPRKNGLLKSGNKSDQIDARKLAELLRGGMLSKVHCECQGDSGWTWHVGCGSCGGQYCAKGILTPQYSDTEMRTVMPRRRSSVAAPRNR
jgi:hypothetical protein